MMRRWHATCPAVRSWLYRILQTVDSHRKQFYSTVKQYGSTNLTGLQASIRFAWSGCQYGGGGTAAASVIFSDSN